jgi:metal transporter CNNM
MRNISLFYLIKPVALALAVPFTSLATKDYADSDEPSVEPGSPDFWFHIIVSAGLVVLGGVFAGYVLYL